MDKNPLKKIKKEAESTLPQINKEIDSIIKNEDTSIPRIERLLDFLLDYEYLNVGKTEFDKLLFYYSSFNPDNTKIYEKSRKEI